MTQRMLIIGDGQFSGSGFGEELRHIMFRLVHTGMFEVYWFNLQHTGYPYDCYDYQFPDIPHKGAKITVMGHRPSNKKLYGAEFFAVHFADVSPDFVLFMGDPKNIRPYVIDNLGDGQVYENSLKHRLGFPLYMYITLDGLPIPPDWLNYLKYVNVLITMTEWAQNEYLKVGLEPAFIHHGINWNWWSTNDEERLRLRKKYRIPLDTKIFITWDVPQHRKRTDALLRAWKMANPEGKNMKLIIYADWRMDRTGLGWNVEDLAAQYGVPRNTLISPQELIGRPKYWMCPQKPETLLEIAKLGDVYVSTTSGEGFGKCPVEAMSLGMPVIITDYSACSEVCKYGSILVPITGTFRMDDGRRSVEGGLVDEEKFTQAIESLYYNDKKRRELGVIAREWSRNFDYDTRIIPQWVNLLSQINPDAIMVKELLQS